MKLGIFSFFVLLGLLFGWTINQTSTNLIDSALKVENTTQVKSTDSLVEEIKAASELTVITVNSTANIAVESHNTLLGKKVGTNSILYTAHGTVRLGIDLSDITASDIYIEDESILHLRIPKAEVQDVKIDVEKSGVQFHQKEFLGPRNELKLQDVAEEAALAKIEEAAIKSGALDKANKEAEAVLKSLLGFGNGYEVRIVQK